MSIWLFLCFVGALLPSIRGHCGFPEVPEFGKVTVKDEEAVYDCGYVNIPQSIRPCINGTWSGDVPLCSGPLKNSFTKKTMKTNETIDLSLQKASVSDIYIQIEMNERPKNSQLVEVSVVRVDSERWEKLQNFTFSLLPLEINTFLLRYGTTSQKLKQIRLTANTDMVILKVQVFGIPLDCNRPDVPFNGAVDVRGEEATYRCQEGFQLSLNTPRRCVEGRWDGSQPVCIPSDEEPITDEPTPEPVETSMGAGKITAIVLGIFCLIALVTFAIYKKLFQRPVQEESRPLSPKKTEEPGTVDFDLNYTRPTIKIRGTNRFITLDPPDDFEPVLGPVPPTYRPSSSSNSIYARSRNLRWEVPKFDEHGQYSRTKEA